jgi:hypothetical protein
MESFAKNKQAFFSYPSQIVEKNKEEIISSLNKIDEITESKRNLFERLIAYITEIEVNIKRGDKLLCHFRGDTLDRIESMFKTDLSFAKKDMNIIINDSNNLIELFNEFSHKQKTYEEKRKILKESIDIYLSFQFPKTYGDYEYKTGVILSEKYPLTEKQKKAAIESIKANRQKINRVMAYDSDFKPLSLNENDFIVAQSDIDKNTQSLNEINNMTVILQGDIQKKTKDLYLLSDRDIENARIILDISYENPQSSSLLREKEWRRKLLAEGRHIMFSGCLSD